MAIIKINLEFDKSTTEIGNDKNSIKTDEESISTEGSGYFGDSKVEQTVELRRQVLQLFPRL